MSNSDFITRTLQVSTYEKLQGLFDKNFDDNLNDFEELMRIRNASEDMGFEDQVKEFDEYIEENFPMQLLNHKAGLKGDYSAAYDQDNR